VQASGGMLNEKDLVPGFSMVGTSISSQGGGGLVPGPLPAAEAVEVLVLEGLPVGVRVKVMMDPCGRSAEVVT
jgi:hypothetical protein